MKKFFAIAFVAASLVACGGNSAGDANKGQKDSSANGNTEQTDTTPAPAQPTEDTTKVVDTTKNPS